MTVGVTDNALVGVGVSEISSLLVGVTVPDGEITALVGVTVTAFVGVTDGVLVGVAVGATDGTFVGVVVICAITAEGLASIAGFVAVALLEIVNLA